MVSNLFKKIKVIFIKMLTTGTIKIGNQEKKKKHMKKII